MSTRSEPRFTRDVDVAVAIPDDDSAEHLVRTLMAEGYRLVASVEHDAAGRLATIRLRVAEPLGEGVVVDLLFASSGVEVEVVAAAEPIEILPSLTVPVAQLGHLIALKILARDDESRPQDLADLRSLLVAATSGDIDLARKTTALISERGYDRGRDLRAALAKLLRSRPDA